MKIGQLVDIGYHDLQGSIGRVVKVVSNGIWLEFPFENLGYCELFVFGESWILVPFDNL